VKIRWRIPIAGMVHGIEDGVKRGDITDLGDDIENALRYVENGMAELELDGEVGPARERPSAQTMAELRAQFAPKQRPLDALRDKMTKARPKTREERLAEIPW